MKGWDYVVRLFMVVQPPEGCCAIRLTNEDSTFNVIICCCHYTFFWAMSTIFVGGSSPLVQSQWGYRLQPVKKYS